MQIEYKTKKLERECTIARVAEKAHGARRAELLHQRIDQIRSADSVEFLVKFKIGRCHPLHGNRSNQYAMDLDHPFRLIFEKKANEIRIVRVVEIVDYH